MVFEQLHFSNKYDSQFRNINNLRWYPAVGRNYDTNKYKILVVGESHYANCESYSCSEYQQSLLTWEDSDSTRQCIIEDRFEFLWERENKTYRNISQLVSRLERPIPEVVWENISYFNLVQELLPNIKFRPSYEQLLMGVNILDKIIDIIHPDLCIIIGVASRDAFRNSNNSFCEINTKIKNSNPFKLMIKGVPSIAIPHLSRTGFKALPHYLKSIVNNVPSSINILDYIADISKDTLSLAEKYNILMSKTFHQILSNISAQYIELDGVDSTFKHDGTPYFGFRIKEAGFKVAFNFWDKNFKGLTAGFYFPDGIPKDKYNVYKSSYEDNGWTVNPHWIYYDVYRLYNWNDLVFDSIKDGSLEMILKSILDNNLIQEIQKLKN